MKTYNLKDKNHFNLFGSRVLNEEGYNRLSEEDRKFVKSFNPSVTILATNSAVINARFITDSKKISIKVELNDFSNMSHMSALGQAGLDLYVYDETLKEFVFFGATVYDSKLKVYEYEFGEFKDNKKRKFILNLPLYMGANDIELLFEEKALVEPDNYNNEEKIIIYGTSITQGGCVSRPGMLHTNIISRWMDTEILNYGFSGSAFLEKEMAEIIAKMENPDLFIIDAQANAGVDDRMKNNLEEFINTYRKFHPNVPIIVATRIRFAVDLYNEEKIKMREFYDKWIEKTVNRYRKTDKNIYLLKGENVFDKYFTEMTVDGIHPNDLGSMKMAEYYFKFIKNILNK